MGVALLALAGCAGQHAAGPFHAGLMPPLPQAHVAIPAVQRTAAADMSTGFYGQLYTAQAGADNQDLPVMAYQLGPAPGAAAWARYSADVPAAFRLTDIVFSISAVGAPGTPPPGPYWIALANYGQQRWEWRGPYSTAGTSLSISTTAPASDYISPVGGQAHCVVLNNCAPGQAPQPLVVDSVTFYYTDSAPSPGWITYTYTDGVYRILAQAGAQPENISLALDALDDVPTLDDSFLTISPDGQWLGLKTNRFDPEADGFAALALVKSDLTSGEAVRAGGPGGFLVHPESIPAVASGGNLIVYSGQGGPHVQDLWAVSRVNNSAPWSEPLLLTGASAEDYNEKPQLGDDPSTVLFQCGPVPYGQAGTMAARVNTDGTGYQILLTATDQPPGRNPGTFVTSPDFAPDGSIIFETDWDIVDEHRSWRLPAGGGEGILLSGNEGANSPSVLPDGRIVMLWLGRPGSLNVHELTVMDADGSNFQVLVPDVDVVDIGMGAGASP
jgi:hypothetical protein